jgi:glycyl-tRNA synthetase beta chain
MGAEEGALAIALDRAERDAADALTIRDYDRLLGVLAELRTPIDAFFDSVLVMDPDERLRTMRLQLLNRFVAVFSSFADFGELAG